ncbi:peptide chain release factor N(5)-glutamine methyltransferase [Anaerotignum faecicola]|nr:peptide chain release factor N(5)-glutamine methyltransferase [Anaerotignum faecicola]
MKTVKDWLLWAKKYLKESGAAEFCLDAELFMMKAVNFTKVQLFTRDGYILTNEETEFFRRMVERRAAKEPAQYILGMCQFMGLDFYVDKNVLIPRPDTEILVEEVIKYIQSGDIKTAVDIGTGSGCIPISLVKYGLKEAAAVDISRGALAVAEKNSVLNGTSGSIKFIESNLFENLGGGYEEYFDAVVSNPPYIKSGVIKTLMPEVRDNEPLKALDGGGDGLYFYREIVSESRKYIRERGFLFFEIGYDQGESVPRLMKENGFDNIKVIKDLAGLDRVVLGRKR